jgi:uncharacterized protein (TIGR00730 family)
MAAMTALRSVCVYCAAATGYDPAFVVAARQFGHLLARSRIRLVYGGGNIGLMGALAQAVISSGGELTGVIPDFLKRAEHILTGSEEVIVTRDLHERKRIMFERSDAFVALPGGVGTLEELVEQLTWVQLGQHKKPIVVANVNGYWTPLLCVIQHMARAGFLRFPERFLFSVVDHIEEIIPTLLTLMPQIPEAELIENNARTIARI